MDPGLEGLPERSERSGAGLRFCFSDTRGIAILQAWHQFQVAIDPRGEKTFPAGENFDLQVKRLFLLGTSRIFCGGCLTPNALANSSPGATPVMLRTTSLFYQREKKLASGTNSIHQN
jgi:hypothetical protein